MKIEKYYQNQNQEIIKIFLVFFLFLFLLLFLLLLFFPSLSSLVFRIVFFFSFPNATTQMEIEWLVEMKDGTNWSRLKNITMRPSSWLHTPVFLFLSFFFPFSLFLLHFFLILTRWVSYAIISNTTTTAIQLTKRVPFNVYTVHTTGLN